MADLVILFPPDKAAPAGRLRDALVEAGYGVVLHEVARPDGLAADVAAQEDATARLLIWSRPLVMAALTGRSLTFLRQNRDLIEVSVDGIAPPAPTGDDRVVLLSGWRGQPFHHGWRTILSRLAALEGVGAANAVGGSRTAEGARAATSAPAVGSNSSARGGGRAALAGGFAFIAVVLLAAVAWHGWGRSRPAPAALATARPAHIARETVARPQPAARDANRQTVLLPPPRPPARTSAPVPPSASSKQRAQPAAVARPARPHPPLRAHGGERPRTAPERPRLRYSRAYSGTMRLFCERSGRGTSECKEFLRATRRSTP